MKRKTVKPDPIPWINKSRRSKKRYVLGLMSGTSADGIDAASIQIDGVGRAMKVRFICHQHRPFSPSMRRRILSAMAPANTKTEELAQLHADLGDAFANAAYSAIKQAHPAKQPSLIGLAGQTVCHLPEIRPGKTVTLQLGEPSRVAAHTGIITVAEFRQSDIAVGGQGAPLVPWTDYLLFKHKSIGRAVQNIGGIANVTWIPPNAVADDVVAFDTGPGNMIIDALVDHVTNGRQRMDRHGKRAANGRILYQILDQWMKHPYLKRKPPKSTGRETFGRQFLNKQLKSLKKASKSPQDWIATATAFTARSIAHAYRRFLPGFDKSSLSKPKVAGETKKRTSTKNEVILAGGGAHNPTLMAMLSAELPGFTIRTIESFGMPASAKEAVSFAILAAACIDGIPANMPQATGANRKAVIGRIVLP